MLIERDPVSYRFYSDCGKCMNAYPLQTRQLMGCGWAPTAPEGMPVQAFDWHGRFPDDATPAEVAALRNKTCPGYTCGLPEVIEVSRARAWREKGSLRDFIKGEVPSDELTMAIDILDAETARATDWSIKNPKKDGHGAG